MDLPLSERICLLAKQGIIGATNDIKCNSDDERTQEAINASAAVVDYALANPGEPYASLEHLQMENDFRLELQGIYRDLIKSSQQAGTCRADVDADMLAQIMMALYFQELNYIVLDRQHNFNVHFKAKVDLVLEGKIHLAKRPNSMQGAKRRQLLHKRLRKELHPPPQALCKRSSSKDAFHLPR